jgi:Putative MetA-pathway of phenol degradation
VRSIVLALLAVGFAFGQPPASDPAASQSASPISTDRPAVTDSSVVVPAGTIQVENGFADTVSQGQRTLDGPETLVRIGVASKTELRLVAPDYFGPQGMGSGFGDLGVGVKQQLGPVYGFDVSVVLTLSLPTGARGISSHGYDPSVQLPWSRSLSPNWTVAGMLSVYAPTEAGSRRVTGETAFLVDRQLTKTCDAFVEYVGDFPEEGGPRHLLHFGGALKLTPNQQIDMHVGVGLSSAAVDHLIGVGYSFRFAAFRH